MKMAPTSWDAQMLWRWFIAVHKWYALDAPNALFIESTLSESPFWKSGDFMLFIEGSDEFQTPASLCYKPEQKLSKWNF